ncbi:DUF3883 domain-containing protein [Pseudoxanthomonas winnipegensis]|uniref:DUF3883 domain-containing protein n=1 Tax=Pseudoxanthomonas winnipegensis TaxID=2480810 RepID=UPI001038F0AC|nr:DUF3883 domain-containing protein [Pseudoxanthomonas winnipegensis]TBV74798.1 DUF3883 domain-containing protein [Pseudoxanthomonas winnipegensis]
MIPLSPGLLVGSFDLLRLVGLTPLSLRDIPISFGKLGGMPTKDVLTVVQGLNWIEATPSGTVELTLSGQHVYGLPDHRSRSRAAILDYIDIVRPAWLQAAAFGRSRVLSFAGSTIGQVLDEAGLVDGSDEATVAFWDALSARARGLKDDRLTAIGRIGERASIEYERSRTGKEPKWVALESNADGYDVLSVVDRSDPRSLSIEVKTTTQASDGYFFVTQNEWQRADETPNHVFHLWRVKDGNPAALPTIVTVAAVAEHIPAKRGDGEWQSVMIPFKAFEL